MAEVHDCFTIAEMMAYEDLGFAEPGEGKELIRNKETYKEGSIPVNVDGGLLSKGHPIGATGGSQIRTIVLQLGERPARCRSKDPKSAWFTTSAASAFTAMSPSWEIRWHK